MEIQNPATSLRITQKQKEKESECKVQIKQIFCGKYKVVKEGTLTKQSKTFLIHWKMYEVLRSRLKLLNMPTKTL